MARFDDGWNRDGYLPEGSYFRDYRDNNGYSPIGSPVYEYIIGDRERQIDQQQPIQPLPMYHSGDDEIFGSQARFNQRRNPNPIDMAQAMNDIENMARINQYGNMARANQYNAQPYSPPYNPTMDDYINQMENENSAAWQYSGGGRIEPLMPNVRQGNNLLYELLSSVFDDRGKDLSQWGREQSIRDTLARDGIY